MNALNRFFFKQHLEDDEHIVFVAHKHWRLGVQTLFWPTLLFAGVWAILYFAPNRYMLYGVALAAVAVLVWWIRNFLDYFLDVWLVTNKGIVDLEWHGWFHRSATRILYSDVEGVTYEVKGILSMLYNYGDLTLEKVSTGTTITMPYVHRPKRVAGLIMTTMEKYIHSKNLKDAKTVQTILAEFVAGEMQKQAVEPFRSAPFDHAQGRQGKPKTVPALRKSL